MQKGWGNIKIDVACALLLPTVPLPIPLVHSQPTLHLLLQLTGDPLKHFSREFPGTRALQVAAPCERKPGSKDFVLK